MIGVRNSLEVTLYGNENTLSVTVDQMIFLFKTVIKGGYFPNLEYTYCMSPSNLVG